MEWLKMWGLVAKEHPSQTTEYSVEWQSRRDATKLVPVFSAEFMEYWARLEGEMSEDNIPLPSWYSVFKWTLIGLDTQTLLKG